MIKDWILHITKKLINAQLETNRTDFITSELFSHYIEEFCTHFHIWQGQLQCLGRWGGLGSLIHQKYESPGGNSYRHSPRLFVCFIDTSKLQLRICLFFFNVHMIYELPSVASYKLVWKQFRYIQWSHLFCTSSISLSSDPIIVHHTQYEHGFVVFCFGLNIS